MASKKQKNTALTVTVAEVRQYEAVVSQLQALAGQFEGQTAKKPDNPVNAFKVNIVNEKLAAANKLLEGEFRPLDGFTQFEEVNLPFNSDVSLVLGAYLSSLERWRSARVERPPGESTWYWRIPDGTAIASGRPSQFQPEE